MAKPTTPPTITPADVFIGARDLRLMATKLLAENAGIKRQFGDVPFTPGAKYEFDQRADLAAAYERIAGFLEASAA